MVHGGPPRAGSAPGPRRPAAGPRPGGREHGGGGDADRDPSHPRERDRRARDLVHTADPARCDSVEPRPRHAPAVAAAARGLRAAEPPGRRGSCCHASPSGSSRRRSPRTSASRTSGPERVDAIVRAVAETVAEQNIAYALPPASWGLGQKIRTPGDVLASHAGTCLDLTLLVAAVLEHLGVAPVVWVAVGHAFLGWWRGENLGLPDAASLQIMSAVNAVDLELLGVLEATALTRERRPPNDLFRRACQLPKDAYFRGNVADLVGRRGHRPVAPRRHAAAAGATAARGRRRRDRRLPAAVDHARGRLARQGRHRDAARRLRPLRHHLGSGRGSTRCWTSRCATRSSTSTSASPRCRSRSPTGRWERSPSCSAAVTP